MSEDDDGNPRWGIFGRFRVCVVTSEDMGKKGILVSEPNNKEKWFDKTKDLYDHMKKRGASKKDRNNAVAFVSPQLRPLRRIGDTIGGDAKGPAGLGFGLKKGKDKEV